MLDGLDDAVTGLSAGESAEFVSTLVGGPQKGEEADIRVTVTQVQEQELPELDDEFAQTASEFDRLEELRDDVAGRLANAGRLDQAAKARDAVLETCWPSSRSSFRRTSSPPRSMRARPRSGLSSTGPASTSTTTWPRPARPRTPKLLGRRGEALGRRPQSAAGAGQDRRGDRGVGRPDDLTQHIFQRAQQEGTAPQQIIAHMQEHPHHIDEYMLEIRRGKALATIVEAATVTDSNGDVVELARIQPTAASVTRPGRRWSRPRTGPPSTSRPSPRRSAKATSRPEPDRGAPRRRTGLRDTPRARLVGGLGQILRFSGSSPKDRARFAGQDVSRATTARVR